MLITQIELENIKSYKHVTVDLQRGTTAISGTNGAGKTTLVEAIGFALFDWMPYKQDQFVREGEKYGRVVVHLIGNDDRPYEIERRCGAGAQWTLYDCEANYRLEQRADLLDKLHELFGIERERSLESLFRDALGVPQGTFTSIFLQTARTRKQTFDALLQIEDYRTAADYLLEAQKQYKEQLHEQEREIQRLTFETRDLATWHETLKSLRITDQELKARNLAKTERLSQQQTYFVQLKQRQAHLQQCETRRDQSRIVSRNAHHNLEQTERSLNEARSAHQIVEDNRAADQSYRQAEAALSTLRKDERQRNELRQQQANLNNTRSTTQTNIKNIQQRLTEIAEARQRILELLPRVEQQVELEKQILTLRQNTQQYESLMKEGRRLYQLREKSQQEQVAVKQRISEIEPLQSLADLLDERVTRLAQLEAQNTQRSAKRLQMEEKQQALQEKKADLEQTAARFRKSEDAIAKIEDHRPEAEEFPDLQEQLRELALQQHHLQGNIESYTDSRNRSAGGQCPLLHQTCLNIKQQGLISLEAYFDELLSQEQAQLAEIHGQITRINERSTAVKKYADALDKLGQYIERRDTYTEHMERLNIEIRRLEREVQSLQEEWEGLKQIEQEIGKVKAQQEESRQADKQTRQLATLFSKVEQLLAQAEQYTGDFEERRHEAEPLKQSKEQLQESQRVLAALNDPRSQSRAAQETVQHAETYQRQLAQAEEMLSETRQQMEILTNELTAYEHLDQTINAEENTRTQTTAGHQLYLKNIEVAGRLSERTQTCEAAREKMAQAEQELALAEDTYTQAAAAFNLQEFRTIEAEIKELEQAIATLAAEMQSLQKQMNTLEQQITVAESLLSELEAAQKEQQTLEELAVMMEQFRKLIKDAAPLVLSEMLRDISAEANRIFGEIMGNRSAQLNWTDDYEISLLSQGIKRVFAQLSGGEQMSAALAVRLALLKKLSGINIAFFDEPTQNMDEQRRSNLAEQIRRVRGFDQLIVISHDDTFEQGLDSLIRLRKQDNQTQLLSENDDFPAVTLTAEQENSYAS
jgi:DNA repair protein SbcC/Rad50